jgi:hypothetical protein
MVHTLADDFTREIAALCSVSVSQAQRQSFLNQHVPRVDGTTSRLLEGRARTLADTKRERQEQLYRYDPRVSPWAGTAHGVLQAVNTFEHHESVVRGDRAERNGFRTLTGEFGKLDRKTWQTLKIVLDRLDLISQIA